MSNRKLNDLIDDLIYLRKGSGATTGRIRQASAIMDVVGGGRDASPETVRVRLTSAFGSITASKGCDALRAALGLDDQPPSNSGERTASDLTTRRQRYADKIGRSLNTIRAWETEAITDLAVSLLSHYYAGAATPPDVVLPHGAFLLDRVQVTTIIRDREFVTDEQVRTITSLADGAKGFIYATYSPTIVTALTGGTFEPPQNTPNGTSHQFIFSQLLQRGQHHTFSFREEVPHDAPDGAIRNADQEITQDFSGQSFETPTMRYDVEVCFLGQQPATIWTYDKLSRIARPGDPANLPNLTPNGHTATATFHELYGGLCSGIAWRW